MLRNLLTSHAIHTVPTSEPAVNPVGSSTELTTLKADIDELYRLSRKGLLGIFFFLAASVVALYFRELTLSGSLSAAMLEQIGPTPPVILVNIIFGVSTINSLLSIAFKIKDGSKPNKIWVHLCFRLFFYILYFISNSLNEYFYILFISGITVLALQHYNIWNYCTQAIDEKIDALENPSVCDDKGNR